MAQSKERVRALWSVWVQYVEDTIVYRPKASATSPHPHVASAPLALTMADTNVTL